MPDVRCARAHERTRLAAKGIDVDAAAAREPCLDRQRFGPAARRDVDEYPLDAMLVESRMASIRHEIAQKTRAGDARSAIRDAHARDVGLAGNRTHRAKEAGRERFVDGLPIGRQRARVDLVVDARDVEGIERIAGKLGNALGGERGGCAQRYADRCADARGEVALQRRDHRVGRRERGLRKRSQ